MAGGEFQTGDMGTLPNRPSEMNVKLNRVSLFVQKFAKLEITQNLYFDRRIQFGPSKIYDSSFCRKRCPFRIKEVGTVVSKDI